jgi:hypothetical protein
MAPESQRRVWRFEQKENRLMTRLMAAALAATLMCGATAFAQDMPSGGQPAPAAPAASDQSAAPAAPAASDQSAAPAAPAAPAAQPVAPATDANVVSNAPSGSPPSDYPPCTHKGQDRCVARGGGGEGHKAAHHHKAKKADAASATPGA